MISKCLGNLQHMMTSTKKEKNWYKKGFFFYFLEWFWDWEMYDMFDKTQVNLVDLKDEKINQAVQMS